MVHGIEGMDRTSAPDRNHRGTNLATEHIVVCLCYKAGPFDKCLHIGRNISKIGRRCKDNTVGIKHFFDAFVQHVCIHHTLFILAFETFPAGGTTPDIFSCQLDKLGSDSLFFEFFEHCTDKNRSIPVLTCTSIECDHLHTFLLFE